MIIKNAIFDLDGTLIDSMRFWRECEVNIIEEIGGFKFTDEEKKHFLSLSLSQMIAKIEKIKGIKFNFHDLCLRANQAMYAKYIDGEIPFKDGAIKFLQKLKDNSIGIALATATPKAECIPFLEKTSAIDYFDAIFTTHDDTNISKSNGADVYNMALTALGGNKETTVVFEDVDLCITTCKKAGYYTVAIKDAMQCETEKEIIKLADRFVTSYNEIDIKNGELI